MSEFDTRLIPNYLIAFATIGVFLFTVVYSLLHSNTLISTIEIVDPKTALVVGGVGGMIITALLLNVRDIYLYFYKKNPK